MSRAIDISEFKSIAYGILEYFKYVCEKYDIFYSLSFGTVLGAVRHNGFIPWDDDIDVCVMRSDYNKLIDSFQKENDDRYKIICTEVDPSYSLPHMKVIDTKTILYQEGRRNNYQLGIWIDVLVLDNVPDDEKERSQFLRKLDKYQKLWTLLEYQPSRGKRKLRSYPKEVYRRLKAFVYRYDSRKCARKLEQLAKKYQSVETKEVGVLSFFPYDRNKSIFTREFIIDTTLHQFEREVFPIPKDYDTYLTKIYGKYMELPPIEKRVSHHNYIVEFKT